MILISYSVRTETNNFVIKNQYFIPSLSFNFNIKDNKYKVLFGIERKSHIKSMQ